MVAEPSVEQPPPDGWADLIALCRTGTRVGHLRDLDAVVYGVGRGVEPYDDDSRSSRGWSSRSSCTEAAASTKTCCTSPTTAP